NQANVTFITNLGYRLYADDIFRVLDDVFGGTDFWVNQADPERIQQFFKESLEFPDCTFDGALVWDTLQFLAPHVLQTAIDRLHRILRPGAALLAFFSADERAQTVPVYSYRIADSKTLTLAPRGHRQLAQFFNNRSLEKMFQNFTSV